MSEMLTPKEAVDLIQELSENMTPISKVLFQMFAFAEVVKTIKGQTNE